MERQETEWRSQKAQLDAECSQLRQQIKDVKKTLVKETQAWETDRTSLSQQLELVRWLISVDIVQTRKLILLLTYLLKAKCLLVLFYGLEACPTNK